MEVHDSTTLPPNVMVQPPSWIGSKFWRVTRAYWSSEQRFSALLLLVAILALSILKVYTVVRLNDAGGRFFNSLQARNPTAFHDTILLIGIFLALQLIVIVLQKYLSMILEIRWRRWLTDYFVRSWLEDETYYRLRFIGYTDNPDQRIADDIGLMIGNGLNLATGGLNSALTVVAFGGVLWSLSGPFHLSIGKVTLSISGSMFWAALLYWIIGSLLGYAVGTPLIRLNNRQQRFEADFRFALIRIREKAEGIALYKGEQQERTRALELFIQIYENSLTMARKYSGLLAFQTFVGDGPSILPFLAIAPRYFLGTIALGDLMKAGNGFGQMSIALSWLVNSFADYASWHATVDRLVEFESELRDATTSSSRAYILPSGDGSISFNQVSVFLQRDLKLFSDLTFELKRGESVLFRGLSGVGKTTLFRVLSGIWPFVTGEIRIPVRERLLFLPQDTYLPIATLRAVLCFARTSGYIDDPDITSTLDSLGLGHLSSRIGEQMHWEQCLSAGERQRVAIAQAVISKPDWLFLDESTSALDETQEAQAYWFLRRALPNTTIVSIGHRITLDAYHSRVISLTAQPQSRDASIAV